ncbi:hypothetical protein Bbelb_284140 [Branchiostoma belcheri]|nr:hypothetical protein Bbelb_284140 [Branchiostoma belcheri]
MKEYYCHIRQLVLSSDLLMPRYSCTTSGRRYRRGSSFYKESVNPVQAPCLMCQLQSHLNEQANSGLIRIQPQLVYMSPSNFMFHASLFLALKNMRVCEDREVNVGCGADTTACISVKMQTYHAS